MDKSRMELISCDDSRNELKISKRELSLGRKNSVKTIAIIVGTVLFLLLVLGDNIFKSLGSYRWILYAGFAVLLIIVLLFQKINYCVSLSFDSKKLSSKYLISGIIPFSKRTVFVEGITDISIIRFNILSTILDGPTIRSLLSIHNKYAVYALLDNKGYERIIGFDNYLEAKNVASLISEKLHCRMLDNTETEYLDEDQYISSYVRYNELLSNVKNEGIKEKDV